MKLPTGAVVTALSYSGDDYVIVTDTGFAYRVIGPGEVEEIKRVHTDAELLPRAAEVVDTPIREAEDA